jgi:hypothetical protein
MPVLSSLRSTLFEAIERRRLRWHFARVAARIESTQPSPTRLATVRALRTYAERGVYPRHGGHGRPRPVFVDDRGVCCAMAFLIENTSAAGLIKQVSESANHAFVDDLRANGALTVALDELNISVEEASAIQPCYPVGPGACLVAFFFQWAAAVAGLLFVPLTVRSVRRRRLRPLWAYAILSLVILGGAASYSITTPEPLPDGEVFRFCSGGPDYTFCGTAFTPRSVIAQIRRFSDPYSGN